MVGEVEVDNEEIRDKSLGRIGKLKGIGELLSSHWCTLSSLKDSTSAFEWLRDGHATREFSKRD